MESLRQSPAYAPVGLLLGAFAWFALKKISEHIPCVDAAQLRKTLLALIFSGAYIYLWTQGQNPHDGEVKENTLPDEIPLLLAGGYYLLHIYPQRCPSFSAHHLISVIAVIAVIATKKGASAANTFGFLVEAATVVCSIKGCLEKLENPEVDNVLNFLYILVIILAKFAAVAFHTYKIIQTDAEWYLKSLTVILALFSFAFAYLAFLDDKDEVEEPKECRRGRDRGKSKTRSRSKSNLRKSKCHYN